jgi:voltage-gated potassium channel
VSAAAFLLVMTLGTSGYWALGHERWGWDLVDCIYMTLVAVTTLGIERLEGFSQTPGVRLFTSVLLLLGIGTFLYFASSLTALILEGDLQHVFRRRRMQKRIDSYSDHVIVCGVGQTGRNVVKELLATKTPFVAVDINEESVARVAGDDGNERFPFIVGDAADDDVLQRAGIERARALIAALTDDKDNLYVVVTARQANPGLRIVARAIGLRAPDKFRKAGADAVISTKYLGGMRLVNEVLRPHVTEFMEEMLRERHINLRMEEVRVPADSPLVGKTIREAHIRTRTGALVLAVRDIETREWAYNPGPDTRLKAGTLLIVMIPVDELSRLKEGVNEGFE